ncbi:MAG: DUF5916 domain-containing protein [Bacteroidota bacterium]
MVELKNFWTVWAGMAFNGQSISNADLRGGPAIQYPGSISSWMYVSTDRRKKLQLSVGPQWLWGNNNYLRTSDLDVELVYRPSNALNISINPSFSQNRNQLQYVTTGTVGGENRYMMADIDQTTFRVSFRATYMLTPNLSIQYWGQPFGTAGIYSNFKYITNARAPVYSQRFTPLPAGYLSSTPDGNYNVDETNKGTPDYSFEKPDFNIGQFRSNMVVRWEYIPGSTVFLVWTQEMNGSFYDKPGPQYERYSFDFDEQAHNIFLMKFTYRFVL